MVFLNKVTDDVARTVVDASSHWRDDQVACWKQACAEEEIPHAKWAMENFIKNIVHYAMTQGRRTRFWKLEMRPSFRLDFWRQWKRGLERD